MTTSNKKPLKALRKGDHIIFTGTLRRLDNIDIKLGFDFLRGLQNHHRHYQILDAAISVGAKGIGYRCALLDADRHPVADKEGRVRDFFVKVPREGGQYGSEARKSYFNALKESVLAEKLTWLRLRDCRDFANVSFDQCTADKNGLPFPVTAQEFLRDGSTLKQLVAYDTPSFRVATGDDFLRRATSIAEAIATIHERRVIHGDIHPGNIFCQRSKHARGALYESERAVLIDFGSALFEDTHMGEVNKNHEFRAPERDPNAPSFPIGEAVDVYSFGKVLYVLATGLQGHDQSDPTSALLLRDLADNHQRRRFIRARLKDVFATDPRYLDIIANCCALDPSDRPRMSEVVKRLRQLAAPSPIVVSHDAPSIESRIRQLERDVGRWRRSLDPQSKNIFDALLHDKFDEFQRTFKGNPTPQAILVGTRSDLIGKLEVLFGHLEQGDSWTAMTTPEAWRGHGLGLEGRYSTATIMATRRQASIRRFVALSIDQLGKDWSRGLAEKLKDSPSKDLRDLALRIRLAADRTGDGYEKYFAEPYRRRYRQYLYDFLSMWSEGIQHYKLEAHLSPGLFRPDNNRVIDSVASATGLMLAVQVYDDVSQLQRARKKNFVSLMKLKSRWFCVATDMRGRMPRDHDAAPGKAAAPPEPRLLGFRIYKSVVDTVPEDRIISFYDLVHRPPEQHHRAVHVGPHLVELCDILAKEARA